MNHLVFVYGTLKEGYGNSYLLSQSKKIGDGQTVASYAMYDCGGFPIVFDDEAEHPVSGQLYEVDDRTLVKLDRLEGNGSMFTRQEIEVRLDNEGIGGTYLPWMYFGGPDGWDKDRLERVAVTDGSYAWKPQRFRVKYRDSNSAQFT